jgi:Glycosyltransferase 61
MRIVDALRRMMDNAASTAQSMREAVAGIANQTDLLNRNLAEIVDGLERQSDVFNRRLDELIGAISGQARQRGETSAAETLQGPPAAAVLLPAEAAEQLGGAMKQVPPMVADRTYNTSPPDDDARCARNLSLEFLDRIVAHGDNEGALVSAKRALIERFGVAEGFRIYRDKMTHLPEQGELHRKPLGWLRQVAEQGAGAYYPLAEAERFDVPMPRVIGQGNQHPMPAWARALFVACLSDARVRARSGFIEVGDVAVIDREAEELARFEDRIDFDASVFQIDAEAAWFITPRGGGASIEVDEAFSLLGIRAHVFGHWMFEYLPKYVAATMAGALPPVPILVEAGMPRTHYQALRLMLAAPVEIIELPPFATARVRRLWCAPCLAVTPWWEVQDERFKCDHCALPPARYAPIAREMGRRVCPAMPPPSGNRIFLARRGGSHELANASAIEALAVARGFRIVVPQHLEFHEQAGLLHHARFVAGPYGSAMFLAYFAKPGARICMLANPEMPKFVQSEASGVLAALGIDVTLFTGPCLGANPDDPARTDYEIDEAAFGRFLDAWLPT